MTAATAEVLLMLEILSFNVTYKQYKLSPTDDGVPVTMELPAEVPDSFKNFVASYRHWNATEYANVELELPHDGTVTGRQAQ